MTSLRWLAWPLPRRSDGILFTYAHGFVFTTHLPDRALCGVDRPAMVTLVRPGTTQERCHWCDQACREMGAPHPTAASDLKTDVYEPFHTFEEWANL